MNILFEKSPSPGVYFHRQLSPHNTMCVEIPGIVCNQTLDLLRLSDRKIDECDIVVAHGEVSERKIDAIKKRHKKPYVYDIDDIWYCTPDCTLYSLWKYNNHSKTVLANLEAADVITCPSEILAQYIKKHTGKDAIVFPNAIAENDPQFTPVQTKSERLRFGFIGGSSHIVDLPIVWKAIRQLWNQYPEYRDKWQIVYGGFNREAETDGTVTPFGMFEKRMAEKRSASIQSEKYLTDDYAICDPEYVKLLKKYDRTIELPTDRQYRRLYARDVFEYGNMFNEIDVALAPLIKNTFNLCKSNLKIVEAGFKGKEVIASDIPTFRDGVTDNDFILCKSTDEWVGAMVSHIENFIAVGSPIKSNLHAVVRQHYNASNFIQKRYELYKTLLR